jgi:hypothetical protein
MKPALPAEPPRQRRSVAADTEHQGRAKRRSDHPDGPSKVPHGRGGSPRNSWVISATRSCVLAPRAAARATRTTSAFSTRGASSRHAALRMRRARFRSTAPPTRRVATAATPPVPGARNTTTRSPCSDRPSSYTRPTARERTWRLDQTRRRSDRQATPALAAPCGQDRATRPRLHTSSKPVSPRPATGVRLIRPLPLGHGRPLEAKTGDHAGRDESIRASDHRWTRGLTTERASRPACPRELWKSPVLWSGPPSPRHRVPRPAPSRRTFPARFSTSWKGPVE